MRRSKRIGQARRKPGEMWNLWKVYGLNTSGEPEATGYLVTTRDRVVVPLAFIRGINPISLKLANLVTVDMPFQAGKEAAKRPNWRAYIDLRLWDRSQIAAKLAGYLLIPVDRLGRRIGNDSTFAGAMFLVDPSLGLSFQVFTHAGLEVLEEDRLKKSEPPVPPSAATLPGKSGTMKLAAVA